MARSEIDDIFAVKSKQPSASSSASTSISTLPPSISSKKTKKSSKKHKHVTEPPRPKAAAPAKSHDARSPENSSPKPPQRKVPETVFDPSIIRPRPPNAHKPSPDSKPGQPDKLKRKRNNEDEDRFKDSRGSGPSTCLTFHTLASAVESSRTGRKTEEGFSIYKEDELGITEQGGGMGWLPFRSPLPCSLHSILSRYPVVPIRLSMLQVGFFPR